MSLREGRIGRVDGTPQLHEQLNSILGPGRVSVDAKSLWRHARDQSPLAIKGRYASRYAAPLLAVVTPTHPEEVSLLLHWANEHRVPVIPYGAGSGVVGGVVPTRPAISLDLSALTAIESIDEENLLVTAQAGVIGGALEESLRGGGFTVGHYPQSLFISTVGGWIATRSSGTYSSLYGNVEDLLAGLEVILPGGTVVQTKITPRSSTGPDYRGLFVGSEGTLGVITRATLRISPLPEARLYRAVGFSSLRDGLRAVKNMLRAGLRPGVIRLYDPAEGSAILRRFGHPPGLWLAVLAFVGTEQQAASDEETALVLALAESGSDLGREPAEFWSENRFDASWFTERTPVVGGVADAIEVANLWTGLEATYERLVSAARPHVSEVYGHFSHFYPAGASLYIIVRDLLADDDAAEEALESVWAAVMEAALAVGATISHHHGIGLQRSRWMAEEHGSGMEVLRRVKAALDPNGIMNPGKLGL